MTNEPKKKKGGKPKNIYTQRRAKKRRRILQQSVLFLLLATAILVLYQRRDSWLPKLEIGLHQQAVPQGDGESNFPLYLTGGAEYSLGVLDKRLAILTDSYFSLYETDGTPVSARQHTYGNAMMQTAGEYALLYESGGTRFRVETAEKIVLEKSVNDPIIFGRIAENGTIAVVTSSEVCACKLIVYNLKGQQVYERSCIEELAELTFWPDAAGCTAVSLQAAGGKLFSVVHSYHFSQKADIWSSPPLDILAVSVYNTEGGGVFVLGDTGCCFLSETGAVTSSYAYPDQLVCGCFQGDTAAVLLSNTEKRTRSVVILKGDAKVPVLHSFDREIKTVGFGSEPDTLLLQLWDRIETVSFSGAVLRNTALPDSCDGYQRIGVYLFLHGYDAVSRLDYRE